MLKIKGLGLLGLFFAQSVGSSHYLEAKNCFTEMDARIPVSYNKSGEELVTGISEDDFMMVLDEVEEVYTPVFENMGKTFTITRLWSNSQVNASANQRGDTWSVNMYGGLARHQHATLDSFRAVVCHEIGHHLGGAPKESGWSGTWASNEGQSDYFATYKCLKKLIVEGQAAGLEVRTPDLSIYETEEIETASLKCSESFSSGEAKKGMTAYVACNRAVLAGLSLGRLLGSLRGTGARFSLNTPDQKVVSRTNHNHPAAQCRVDTYLAGSLCNLDFNSQLDNNDPDIGTCNRADGFTYGVRPLCWFKPS